MTDDLIRTDDAVVFGDKGYVSDKRKRASRADGVLWAVKDRRKLGGVLSASQKKRNRKHGSVRAKVEHIFRVIKCQFGYRKARYRGLAKNAAQMFSLMALANLYLARQCLRAESVENRENPVKRVPNQPKLAENHQIPGRGQQARSSKCVIQSFLRFCGSTNVSTYPHQNRPRL